METRAVTKPQTGLLGPGRLVLVVGPSGAGKDTLINGARLECEDDSTVVFPRRVVTRPPSVYEDHETVDLETFNRGVADRKFALWWDAHGHRYGVPIFIDDDIRSGRTACTWQGRRRLALPPPRGVDARIFRPGQQSGGNMRTSPLCLSPRRNIFSRRGWQPGSARATAIWREGSRVQCKSKKPVSLTS